MKPSAIVGIVFALHLTLGNVCLMGTAYAASPEDPSASSSLSREVPMSFNVVTCAWTKTDDGWTPANDSPCASGHCLKKDPPPATCIFALAMERATATLPITTASLLGTLETDPLPSALPSDRPPILVGLASIVLRM